MLIQKFKTAIAVEGLKFLKAGFVFANCCLNKDPALASSKAQYFKAEHERILARLHNEYPGFLKSQEISDRIIAEHYSDEQLAAILDNPEAFFPWALDFLTNYKAPAFLRYSFVILRFKGTKHLKFNFENRGWTYANQHLEAYAKLAAEEGKDFLAGAHFALVTLLPLVKAKPELFSGLVEQLKIMATWAQDLAKAASVEDVALLEKASELKKLLAKNS